MAGQEYRYAWVGGDRVRVPIDGPGGDDARPALHVPGELPTELPAVEQSWDGLRPVLRERLSGELGRILMWWRDDDDPYRTRVSAFGERAMCVAEPATRHGRAGHRLDLRRWMPGFVEERGFRGPGPDLDTPVRARARDDGPAAVLTLPPEVSALLGHLPEDAQRYLQAPLLAGGGAADGVRWYQKWDQLMDVWLWLRAGRAVTFAHGQRIFRGGLHWELRCWRATYAGSLPGGR
jgi:hypothetical protein